MEGRCSWCQRRPDAPLGQGEICDVCLGLCSFAFLDQDAALYLYKQSAWWVGQTFSYLDSARELLAPGVCWWCSRRGQAVPKIVPADADLYFADPTLCAVCDHLLIPTPPTALGIDSVKRAYDQICLAVEL